MLVGGHMDIPKLSELDIARLGECCFPSPVAQRGKRCINEDYRVLVSTNTGELQPFLEAGQALPSFEPAGPRAQLYFPPAKLTRGIVTCGGLCPGINNAIRAIVLELHYAYGVSRILGFRYGYAGLTSQSEYEPWLLSPAMVDTIHEHGGTLLGTSRGQHDIGDMVDTLMRWNVGILFVIGGDGTMRGARALYQEISHRKLHIGIIGIPKTIDNDLAWIERSFGFNTAVAEARRIVAGAHAEARGAWNGIGLVKLMGRYAGFIAAHASLASSDVNFCLVPEAPLTLDGEFGFLRVLERRLDEKHHAVIVVAEGAGQDLLQDLTYQEYDPSGNRRLKDIGGFLRDQITHYCAAQHKEMTLKYIDPSYTIRSLPADSLDAECCLMLGQHAVHAGMAGCTDMLVSYWNQHFVHVPMGFVTNVRPQLDMQGEIWQRVLEATGQPALWSGRRQTDV
jgi:6-phosphofructokinase 1